MARVQTMQEEPMDDARRQRLLECWLPLAQQVMQDLGATYTPAELEALILTAAGDLAETDSATTARAVLWRQHLRNRSNLA
jgi:hypothetical protein